MSEFLTEKELLQKTFGGTTFNHFFEWYKKMYGPNGAELSKYYITEIIIKIQKLSQKKQKIWNKNYIKFKGFDSDIFTPFNGDDSCRIEFISKIVKHINFINKLNYWQVDPESIKLQISKFDEVSIIYPVRYLNKNEYKY